MRRARSHPAIARVIISMIALYALLLQALVATATPSVAAELNGAICAPQHDGSGPKAPADHHHQCCTVAHLGIAAPPPGEFTSVSVTPAATHLVWRPEAALPRTGPPTHASSARGPPVA